MLYLFSVSDVALGLVVNFILIKKKPERIKQNTLIGDIARNGLYRVDVNCELKLSK